ncbi:MAG: gas vesicle protein [Actinomycetota bacterium]|nr:gas vesicle protein [Actinomycetota bacterium]
MSEASSSSHAGKQDRPQVVAGGLDALTLVDLIDRLVDTGVVLSGQAIVSVADVELLYLDLRLLLSSVQTLVEREEGP